MDFILHQLIKNKIIDNDEYDEYKYALNVLLLKIIHYFIIFVVSAYMNIIIQTIVFLYCYSTIRTYVGGIHANNPVICLLISILFIIGLKQILDFSINYILIIIISILISYYWYVNCYTSLSSIKFLFHLIFINVVLLILATFNQSNYINCILYSHILNAILFYLKNKSIKSQIYS